MMWFAAHIVTVFRYRNRRQRKFQIWENVVLIEAADANEGWEKARAYGEESCAHDSGWHFNGIPSTLDYVGVRKLITVEDEDQ